MFVAQLDAPDDRGPQAAQRVRRGASSSDLGGSNPSVLAYKRVWERPDGEQDVVLRENNLFEVPAAGSCSTCPST